MVSVKVQLPAAALGIVIAPVETVTKPEFDKVVVTFKVFAPIASVPAVMVKFVAVIVPAGVNVPPDLLSVSVP